MATASPLSDRGVPIAGPAPAIRLARQVEGDLSQIAAELGFATECEEDSLRAVGEAMGIEVIDLSCVEIDPAVLANFPAKLIHRFTVFPIRVVRGSLMVVIGNPLDLHALDTVSAAVGMSVLPVLAPPVEVARLIKTHLGVGSETIDGLLAQQESRDGVEMLEDVEWDRSEDSQMAQEASVVRLVNEILVEAVEARASDIHLEAQAGGIKIRYRVDGVLQDQPTPPEINRFHAAIISRLKIMARLNIAEKRVPQDGRIKLRVQGRQIDIRTSIIPMLYGEGVVMRILDKDRMQFSLRGVGMDDDIYQQFSRLIQLPHGIILVTGPTGSGKTTTLYSALNEIKDEKTKIITTEDPIEYQLDGINQIQVHTKVGLTFASSLRSILRHDPDVILVGEIRDLETAQNAVQASLTGHLVFSTLHTNDAPSTVTRMRDMGVPPFLLTATVEAVLAQRLVRKICSECREETVPSTETLSELNLTPEDVIGKKFYRGRGCTTCNNTGFKGRTGLFELMVVNDALRDAINRGGSTEQLRDIAIQSGMRSLRLAGLEKVFTGLTVIEEVIRETIHE